MEVIRHRLFGRILEMTTTWGAFRNLAMVLAIVAIAGAAGCSKKKKGDEEPGPTAGGASASDLSGDSDSGKAGGMNTVHFEYDSYVLTAEAKGVLDANSKLLQDQAALKIQVEGHCDERGGIQYNLALGEKRAAATRKYLVDKGVDSGRVTTISYGKERPIEKASTEAAWAKNRRANFVVTSN
jgi:peptidoglycan-associated lipoprotein